MAYFRIMMKAQPGFMPECWAECDHEEQIPPLIREMRQQFGPTEPARIMKVEGVQCIERVFRIDDPANLFTPEEREGPFFEFDQQDHGAKMPPEVKTVVGTCSQCGRTGPVASVHLKGMGQDLTVTPCVECLFDLASGTEVVPVRATVETATGPQLLTWHDELKEPLIVDVEGQTREVNALLAELKLIGNADPHPFDEHYGAFLGADRARTREIGQRLYEIGTHQMMQAAYEALREHLPPAGPVHLNHAWDGVGEWLS
jgi:hypothetical protein